MNLHEYQSKKIFAAYGIPVPAGEVATTPEAAVAAARRIGGSVWVVKAQVHAGGRGKAGGVKVVKDLQAVRDAAAGMLGRHLLVPLQAGDALEHTALAVRMPADASAAGQSALGAVSTVPA